MMPTMYLQHNPYNQGPGNISEEEAELQKTETPRGPAVRQKLLDTARKLCSWTLNNMFA